MLLENKIALITEASSELGRVSAFALADEGALVILLGRNQSALQRIQSAVQANGGKAEIHTCDLSGGGQPSQSISQILQRHGRVDILVNHASAIYEKSFLELSPQGFAAQMRVHFNAPMLFMRAVLPSMLEQQSGVIVNVASAGGQRGLPGASAYAASHAALISLTQSVGEEMRGSGIRINCICPGPVDTGEFHTSAMRSYEMKRGGDLIKPQTVANTILYLASDMSRGVSCQTITVRGANRW